jgi:hypothetical protein
MPLTRKGQKLTGTDSILAYRATNGIEARSLAAHLANAGISARVLGETLQGAYAGIDVGGMNTPEVWVAAGDRELAETLISAWRRELPLRATQVEDQLEAEGRRPQHFQYSLMTALTVTTVVAILAALVGRGLVQLLELPGWVFYPVYTTLVIVAFQKYGRRVFHRDRR